MKQVMMSVCMEKVPPRFAEDWLAVVCPVAKRRIVVAYLVSIAKTLFKIWVMSIETIKYSSHTRKHAENIS